MACSRCNQLNCIGGCIKSPCNSSDKNGMITRNNSFENKSGGRDGESAYQLAVRKGFTGTEDEFNELNLNNSYTEFNW